MQRQTLAVVTLPLALLVACSNLPSDEEVAQAEQQISEAMRFVHRARTALELLGLLPSYECGTPQRTFVGQAVESARLQMSCVTATTETAGNADLVKLQFPTQGCAVSGRDLSGEAVYSYSGGDERMDMEVDFHALLVGGEALPAKAGYGTCGDESRYWGQADGELSPRHPSSLSLRVGTRDGLPLIGGTTLLVDGDGRLGREAGNDLLSLSGVVYEAGEYLPKEGTLIVETASGRRFEVTFETTLWRLGKAEVAIDGKEPVTIPIVR